MLIDEAIEHLRRWCEQSAGAPLELAPGRIREFQSYALFNADQLQIVEQQLAFRLPDSYRAFMSIVGQSHVFRLPHYASGGMQFFSPQETIQASLGIWDGEEEVTDRFCLVGWHRSMGDYFGFAIEREEPQNFDVFCHEYPADEYVAVSNEIKSWRTFDEWIIRAVQSCGEDTL